MPDGRETITFEKMRRAGWVYFSRPERMNALAPESLRELWSTLGRLEGDSEIRVGVFSGRGDAFCAGIEMAGMEKMSPIAARRRSREIQMLTNRISELTVPTIAAVNGVAMGAGLEICLACDLAIASTTARFAYPEVRLGMIPFGGGTQRLARMIGLRRAKEIILGGRILDAAEALDWGLVNAVTDPADLAYQVEELCERLAQGGRTALFQAKRCINHAFDLDINRGLEYETECFTTCFSSGEPSSGLKRFVARSEEPANRTAAPESIPREPPSAPSPPRVEEQPAAPPARTEAPSQPATAEVPSQPTKEEVPSQPRFQPPVSAEPEPPEDPEEEEQEDIFE
jgi:enoyl-CoA hydratase